MRTCCLVRTLGCAVVVGAALACSAPTGPTEMPPLAPRPDRVQPLPAPRTTRPVPGAPDVLSKRDAGAAPSTEVEPGSPATDVGSGDAARARTVDVDPATLPGGDPPRSDDASPRQAPPGDAGPDADASTHPESTSFSCC